MQLDDLVDFFFDLSESASIGDLDYLLDDLPARARELEVMCRGQFDVLSILGHVWASILSNPLLKQPEYRQQRQVILDALTSAADTCRS
jgi:hypothetical protein